MEGPLPLPSGWTEHVGPQGQPYYYNQATGQSTYDRPVNVVPPPPPPPLPAGFSNGARVMPQASMNGLTSSPSSMQAGSSSQNGVQADISSKPKAKKEKPAKKEPIPGATGWLKVTTNMGNIFYTHVESKRSEWTVPDEIKEYVDAMHEEERRVIKLEEEEKRLAKEQEEEEMRLKKEQERLQRQKEEEEELERRREELRKREEAVRKQREERERIQKERMRILEEQGRRKRMESGEDDEDLDDRATESNKRARMDGELEDDHDEIEWQRQMAAEMAAEAEAADDVSASSPPITAAAPSVEESISLDEKKTLFMHMLTSLIGTSKEVNPMAPWDRELPKFVHERDYTVLSSVRDRQDAFNEWCKLRLREKRKQNNGTVSTPKSNPEIQQSMKSTSDVTSIPDDASNQYRFLLEAEVKSTRTKWEDFKKAWRKDRRFFSYGRDDREREKGFRDWLKELGERKRMAAEQADEDFITLLEERLGSEHRLESGSATEQVHASWSKAKKVDGLDRDARYEAVGSSSRRADIYGEWAQGSRRPGQRENGVPKPDSSIPIAASHTADGADRALREREEAVERKRREVDMQKQRAFGQATRDESITTFKQLLIDAVRDPLMSVSSAIFSISDDGRSRTQGLHTAEKERLVYEHIEDLNVKRLRELQAVFERHAPTLDVEAEVALPLIKDDDEMERRHLTELKVLQSRRKDLLDVFEDWNKERIEQAYASFQQMLKENAFVNFWGRLRQEHEQRVSSGKEGTQNGARQGEDEEDDDEPDLLQMAGKVDLEEIHSILRNDSRYRAFRHQPAKRDEWIRRHLQTMAVPKKTVYQQDH